MFRILGKICCVLTMITLINGFDIIFQSYAWGSMLYDRVPNQGVEKAIESTFSGDAPCPKCLALKAAQEEKRDRDLPADSVSETSAMAKWIPNQLSFLIIPSPPYHRTKLILSPFSPPLSPSYKVETPPPNFV